ncbi:ACP S-malonyltransferase [Streptomyces sp. H27-S2]|uniref:ACP S-malonyltransferase n=1 Tax=Streptomyces antarcticus TaxID=2996458 RepID=UPI00226DC08A|nr:ACP S-malonyltransferase [Streptomyces sp. H27-S2]MCY0947993.1 ACP S-malonyltransferase [Streptomyces sp. H27-S2]
MKAFLFPGQGTQKVGMGSYLREEYPGLVEPLWQEADEILGYSLSRLCEEGPVEKLRHMPVTQPAVFLCSYTALVAARAKGAEPDVVAGHSLGEYSALAAAGVLTWREVLQLVHRRGELMAQVQEQVDGKMAAVLGLSIEQVERACAQVRSDTGEVVEVANHNEPLQAVVSGQTAAIDLLVERVTTMTDARATVLRIGGPAHSSLMGSATADFVEYLQRFDFRPPRVPLISGSTAALYASGEEIKRQLGDQLVHRVRWVDVMAELKRLSVSRTWELGPGKVLSGFVQRSLPGVPSYRANDLPSFLAGVTGW